MKLPTGWHSLTPRIVTEDVASLVEFLRRAFGATGSRLNVLAWLRDHLAAAVAGVRSRA
jgi:hypothetical protein